MARRTRIPKFGSWDSSDGVGAGSHFTEAFDDAIASKGSRGSNPDNADAPRQQQSQHHQNGAENEVRRGQSHSRRPSRESDLDAPSRRPMELPAYRVQVDNSRYVPQGPGREHSDNGRRIGQSHSANEAGGAEHLENGHHLPQRSPMHHHQRQPGNRVGSPAWERKEGSATPGRSRLRNNSTEPADKGGALPKFGAWDPNDPTTGDGFTVIFNNARNERKSGGAVHVPPLGFDGRGDKDLYPGKTVAPQSKSSSKLLCCFQPTVMEA